MLSFNDVKTLILPDTARVFAPLGIMVVGLADLSRYTTRWLLLE